MIKELFSIESHCNTTCDCCSTHATNYFCDLIMVEYDNIVEKFTHELHLNTFNWISTTKYLYVLGHFVVLFRYFE